MIICLAVVSKRIANAVRDNDIEFVIFGPVRWHVAQNTFTGPALLKFGSLQGWKQDPVRGTWTSIANPSSDYVERVVPFLLKEFQAQRQ